MKDQSTTAPEKKKRKASGEVGGSFGLYGLGFIGALVYYIQQSDSFREGFIGFLKALVWPAIVIYKLLESLYK